MIKVVQYLQKRDSEKRKKKEEERSGRIFMF